MKILIACGGTGGHIFPGMSLYDVLAKRQGNKDILLALDKRVIPSLNISDDYRRIYIGFTPIKFNFNLQSPLIVSKLIKGIFESLKLLWEFKPAVVVGFGGYATFFILFFARIFRIKTLIHEPNLIPGRANRMLALFVHKIACGFAETAGYFGASSFKVKFTGTPLRKKLVRIEKSRAYELLGLSADRFTILVMGGSQGAHRINTLNLAAVNKIIDSSRFQIIHLGGSRDCFFLENGYRHLKIKARVFAFLDQMQYAYSAADMVISRAGAVSINEIAFFGLPSILVPFAYVRRHQIENAAYLRKNNAAIAIEEKDLTPDILKDRILELFSNPALRESMGRNVSMLYKPGADESLADLVLNE